ncbi:hypothetical protein IW261DRAFT_437474 [Armillaria novae-zelandiae]|uniref:Uncharacterized protein n=1 Tax=Armillaria novae-zelandiae TaxID=153914 RepID=A0AA39P334_9AGAR|nr:hypothetical protein IW261DRAFT_437474 [Armillaria novae-zelandiae]
MVQLSGPYQDVPQCRYKIVVVIRSYAYVMSKVSLKGSPHYEHLSQSCMDSSSISSSWTWPKSPHKPSRIHHPLIPSPPPPTTFFYRNWSVISLALLTTATFVWTAFFAHASTDLSRSITHFHGGREIKGEPDPPLIQLGSPSMAILLLQISTSATTLLLGELAIACYERVRWQRASSLSGLSGGTLLGLSRATSIIGVALLSTKASVSWSTRLWCLKRMFTYIVVSFVGVVFLFDINFITFFPVTIDMATTTTTGWGGFNSSLFQYNPLGFQGFLTNPRQTFPVEATEERCHATVDSVASLANCTSYAIVTSVDYLGADEQAGYSGLGSQDWFSEDQDNDGRTGYMPMIETPWIVSFYPHAYGHHFSSDECQAWIAPYYYSEPGKNDVALRICLSALDNGGRNDSTTILAQITVCGGVDGNITTGDCHAALDDPSYTGLGFHGASEAVRRNPSLNLTMTVTKRTASPVYDLKNGSVMDIEIPFYQHPGLMDLTPESWWAPVPADRDAPIPASIDADAFRNFTFSIYDGVYGNVSDMFSVPNAMINTMVRLMSTSNSLFAYEHAKDLLAYTLRSGSNLPASAPLNFTRGFACYTRDRLQISQTSWILFMVLGGSVLLSCYVLIVLTSMWNQNSYTTFFPEVDFAAGFVGGGGNDHHQADVVSRLQHVSSGEVVDSMASTTFRIVIGRRG